MRRRIKNRLAQSFIAVISYLASFEAENSLIQGLLENVVTAYQKCNFQDCLNAALALLDLLQRNGSLPVSAEALRMELGSIAQSYYKPVAIPLNIPGFVACWLEEHDCAVYPLLLLLGNKAEGKIKEAFFIHENDTYQRIGVRQGSVGVKILTLLCQPENIGKCFSLNFLRNELQLPERDATNIASTVTNWVRTCPNFFLKTKDGKVTLYGIKPCHIVWAE